MPKGGTPLPVYTDFMGNRVSVGDSVIVTRVPDRAAQMYTAEVLGIEEIREKRFQWGPHMPGTARTMTPLPDHVEIKVQVEPTGKYSTDYWYHDWPQEVNVLTGLRERTGVRPKPQWVQSRNILKYPP